MNLTGLQDATYAHLGTSSSDRALTPTKVTRALNDALNELYADLPSGYLYVIGTWTPDGGTGRVYSLSGIVPAVTSLRAIVSVRIGSATGAKLREMGYRQVNAYSGMTYAITGADETAKLITGEGVTEGATLYVTVEGWPAELADVADVPSSIPLRFHDVPPLMAAEVLFASGGESAMPPELRAKLIDRRAQWQAHVSRRSADVMKHHEVETLTE